MKTKTKKERKNACKLMLLTRPYTYSRTLREGRSTYLDQKLNLKVREEVVVQSLLHNKFT